MSQETEHEHHHNHDVHHHTEECLCKNKYFKKFLIVALGTFVGGYCALSLFCALHKPPMMMNAPFMMHHKMMHQQMMNDMGFRENGFSYQCHKKMMKKFNKECEKAIEKNLDEQKD